MRNDCGFAAMRNFKMLNEEKKREKKRKKEKKGRKKEKREKGNFKKISNRIAVYYYTD